MLQNIFSLAGLLLGKSEKAGVLQLVVHDIK